MISNVFAAVAWVMLLSVDTWGSNSSAPAVTPMKDFPYSTEEACREALANLKPKVLNSGKRPESSNPDRNWVGDCMRVEIRP